MNKQVITRFAPSPTGHMHAGSYRTAFFAYLFAKKHGGKFVLRIEDTDRERSKQEYTDEIFSVFEIIGIKYDEKYIQSEHVGRHKELLQKLISEDKAYISKEEAKDGSGVIKDIVRFRNPNKVVTFIDLIRGEIKTDTTDLGDFVIAKNLEEPIFHFAVVIDDHDEGITHIIRAEEHISNTPRQILIHEALGFEIPHYAHLPLVLAPDKSKMSKRKGAIPVIEYLERGYLPEALLNAICLCGWNPGTEQEIFSREELEKTFDLDHVQKAGAIFNEEKLNWFNREYIKKLSIEEQEFWTQKYLPKPEDFKKISSKEQINQLKKVIPFKESTLTKDQIKKLTPVIMERINYFGEIRSMVQEGEFDYYFSLPIIDLKKLPWKSENIEDAKKHLVKCKELLSDIDNKDWNMSNIQSMLMPYATEVGKGNVLWPFRFALSGKDKSPDPFTLAFILGKQETINRVNLCLNLA